MQSAEVLELERKIPTWRSEHQLGDGLVQCPDHQCSAILFSAYEMHISSSVLGSVSNRHQLRLHTGLQHSKFRNA